jgi:hypothetical protein
MARRGRDLVKFCARAELKRVSGFRSLVSNEIFRLSTDGSDASRLHVYSGAKCGANLNHTKYDGAGILIQCGKWALRRV